MVLECYQRRLVSGGGGEVIDLAVDDNAEGDIDVLDKLIVIQQERGRLWCQQWLGQ